MKTNVIFFKNWQHLIIPILVMIGLVSIRLLDFEFTQRVHFSVLDTYQKWQPRVYENVKVKIIDVDDETLATLGQWPWPRTRVAELVTKLHELGAVAIGFDAVFAEADKTSPQNIVQIWQQNSQLSPELQAQITQLQNHDEIFAQAVAKAKNVVLSFTLESELNSSKPRQIARIIAARPEYKTALPTNVGTIKNLDQLEAAAAGNGSYDIKAEVDSIVRHAPLLFRLGDSSYPSLALELLRVQQHANKIIVNTTDGENSNKIKNISVGRYTIPTDETGNLWIYYTPHEHQRVIPVWQILDKNYYFDLQNTIAIIGTSAAGLKDQRATPLTPFASSVEIHANVLEQIILGKFLSIPTWVLPIDIGIVIFWGIFFMIGMQRLGPIICLLISLAFIATLLTLCIYIFKFSGGLIDPAYASFGVLSIYFVISLLNYLKTESERNHVRNAFNRYLSPTLTEQLVKNPEKLELGGEMRDMTILFCDIREFTSISENFDAHGLTQFINQFLTPMTKVILENKGTIDKYIGDCIMAFWNAPLYDPDHTHNASASALIMLDELVKLNERQHELAQQEGRKFMPINIGIGLNSGLCCVGNLGSEMRFDYSVLGDDVNLASRLEGQSKVYGVNIIIGEVTQKRIEPFFATLELDLIQVKGKKRSVRIYTLLGDSTLKASTDFTKLSELHETMLQHYRAQHWHEALDLVVQCENFKNFKLEAFYRMYEDRIHAFMAQPPAEDWDGLYVATSK